MNFLNHAVKMLTGMGLVAGVVILFLTVVAYWQVYVVLLAVVICLALLKYIGDALHSILK